MSPSSLLPNLYGLKEPRAVSWRLLILLTAAGALLRAVKLNSDLWLDEIGTVVTYLRLPLNEIVRTYVSANQHLLYSVLGRVAVQCFGESPWVVRLPAVLFGIAAIPAMYYMARVVTSEREALLSAAFLSFSYHHVWFSQDARGYSAMVFWTLLGTGFLFRALLRGPASYWIGYTLAMTLGVVSLQNTLFVVIGQLCAFLLLLAPIYRRQHESIRLPFRSMLTSVVAIIALSLLCHGLILVQMVRFFAAADRTALGWTKITEFIPVVTNGLLLGFGIVGLAGVMLLVAAGWYSYWTQTRLVAGIMVLPVLLNLAALIVLHTGAYPRSFLYELPFALLIAVRGATRLSECAGVGPSAATAVSMAMLVLAALPLIQYYRFPKQDFTGALRYVLEHKAPGDHVMAADLAGVCYRKYYFPGIAVPGSVADIETLRKSGGKVWMLYSFPREFRLRSPEMLNFIRTRLDHVAVFHGTLGGGDLYVARTR